MKKKGILKGADRKEPNWKKAKLGEPFKEALDRFREKVLGREDFDPTSLLQFGLFMSKAVINVLKEAEAIFRIEGQKMVNNALIKTGYDLGKQIVKDIEIPPEISPIEIVSFLATVINTQAWTSIEDPRIDYDDQCSFDIIWCPLQDVYSAFDCRVQRYLVQGILDAFRELNPFNIDYQVEFRKTIPAGGDTCLFVITKKKPGDSDKWEEYSRILERRALKRMKERKKK
ncbi:MAG: hypothetical protein ACFFAH_12990 [Promethearchaeota archaeon]